MKGDRVDFMEGEGMSDYILSEVADIVDCEHKTAPQVNKSNYYSIRTTDISNGKINFESANRVSEETYLEWTKRATPEAGDIILAREAPVGEVGWIKEGYKVCLGQRTVLVKVTHPEVLDRFLLYYLVNPDTKYQLQAQSTGSVVEHLNMKDIRNFRISLPTLPEQKAIAQVLSSLDDKIDLLHRQNKTLEAIAETLFRQWFIEEAQDDWEERELKNIIEFIVDNRGKTAPTSETGVPLIATNCIKNANIFPVYEKVRYVSDETYRNWFRSHPKPGDLIFVNKGTPGCVNLVPNPVDFCIAQDMIALRVNKKYVSNYYLFLFMRSEDTQNQIVNSSVGTTIPHLKKTDLLRFRVVIPDAYTLNEFNKIVDPLFLKMNTNFKQIRMLEKIRNILLPKLMSGEVRTVI